MPSPWSVLLRFTQLAGTVSFWEFTAVTLLRIILGAVCGVVIGSALAVLTFTSHTADIIISPALRVVRTVPVASFIILILLWVRTSLVPAVIAGLMVVPLMWEAVTAGLGSADPKLLEMASSYRMGRARTARYIYIPAVRPYFVSAILSSLGLAWKSGVAAEALCLPKKAIGTQLYNSKLYLDIPSLFAWTGIVIILSLIIEYAARRLLSGSEGSGHET